MLLAGKSCSEIEGFSPSRPSICVQKEGAGREGWLGAICPGLWPTLCGLMAVSENGQSVSCHCMPMTVEAVRTILSSPLSFVLLTRAAVPDSDGK